ncbi:MAG: polysaccharide biosynthesis/export family protein [Deltaproteobacteria bacterium]|nr:polysaccharide biosynthesis/export family protein [Deltaproteobacteria bacterium]
MRARSLVLACLLVGLSACRPVAPKYDYGREPDPRKAEYVLGIGDQLGINVWENAALSTDALIRPDGTITMPLVGDLKAAGETPSTLKAAIKERLVDFVKLPGGGNEITVAVKSANSYRITVSGEVAHPGVFGSDHYISVAEAVALAGGFTRFAKRNSMTLQRRDAKTGAVRMIPLAYDFLVDGSHPEMNLTLIGGDSLFVP